MNFISYQKHVRCCDLPIEYLIKMSLIPPFQRIENSEHIDLIYKSLEEYYLKYNDIFLPGVISVGRYSKSSNKDKFIIFDGQHRIKSLQKLLEKYDVGNLLTRVDIYSIQSDEEALGIYHIINSNIKVELFDGNIEPYFIPALQKFMKDTFPENCKTTKNPRGININLEDMSKRVKGHHLIEKLGITLENAKDIVFDRIIKLNQFYKKQKPESFIKWGINDFEEKYEKYLANSDNPFYLGLWRNFEWIEVLMEDDINNINNINNQKIHMSSSEEIKTRQKIPASIREKVWEKRNGKIMTGECFVCNRNIKFINFHCGHILSVRNGGGNAIDNLEPICNTCNSDMGTMNLMDYKKLFI